MTLFSFHRTEYSQQCRNLTFFENLYKIKLVCPEIGYLLFHHIEVYDTFHFNVGYPDVVVYKNHFRRQLTQFNYWLRF